MGLSYGRTRKAPRVSFSGADIMAWMRREGWEQTRWQ